MTGLSGSGKSTVASMLAKRLSALGAQVEILDGDVVRTNLSKGLGFSKEDRDTNIRRIGFVCNLLSRNGVFAIAAAISPYRAIRAEVRAAAGNFVEVFTDCPLDTLVERDVKGLYKKALAGEIKNFTGVSDPYEAPESPEVRIDSSRQTPEESTDIVWQLLDRSGTAQALDRACYIASLAGFQSGDPATCVFPGSDGFGPSCLVISAAAEAICTCPCEVSVASETTVVGTALAGCSVTAASARGSCYCGGRNAGWLA